MFILADWETLSLTEEEYELPVWQKAITTHVVDTRRITIKNDDSENEQELGLSEIIQDRFSDEEDTEQPVLEGICLTIYLVGLCIAVINYDAIYFVKSIIMYIYSIIRHRVI